MSTLRIELRSDPAWACMNSLALAVTLATIAWLALIVPVVAACASLMAAGFIWQEWAKRRRRPTALAVDAEGQWAVEFEEGNLASGRLLASSVLPQLALMTIRLGDGTAAGIAVTPGMAGRDSFRRLCALLRHAAMPVQGATHVACPSLWIRIRGRFQQSASQR